MAGDEKLLKHLEFTQALIARMATSSFLLKAWAVTLVAGLFALAANNANARFVLIAYIPAAMFWTLDGYFLHQERLYRALYDRVRVMSSQSIDFSLDTTPYCTSENTWIRAILSKTLSIFYGTLLMVIVVASLVSR